MTTEQEIRDSQTIARRITGYIGKYEANVMCGNCGFVGKASLECGKKVSQNECPECDCLGLLRKVII